MNPPFFSIVIPTRNRPDLIVETVISAIAQNFEGFEVILSDNSSDSTTRDKLRQLERTGSLTYVKPERELTMPDHWEFATLQAKGQYVLVLTDRSILNQGALAKIHRAISRFESRAIDACSWRWSLFDDELGIELTETRPSETTPGQMYESAAVAAEFVEPRKDYPYKLPRALNSCYSARVAAKIRTQHGRLFRPLSPDFTSAFLTLAHIDQLLYIDAPLFISRGLTVSTGGNSYRSSETSYLEGLGLTDWYKHVPIKAVLVENLLIEDYLDVHHSTGNKLPVKVNWVEYFIRCYREILRKNLEKHQIDSLLDEWKRALATMDGDLQREVGSRVRSMWGPKLQAAVNRVPCGARAIIAIQQLRKTLRTRHQIPTTVLHAAGFDSAVGAFDTP